MAPVVSLVADDRMTTFTPTSKGYEHAPPKQITSAYDTAAGLGCYLFRTEHNRNSQHERNRFKIRRDQLRWQRHAYRQLRWRRDDGRSAQFSACRVSQSW